MSSETRQAHILSNATFISYRRDVGGILATALFQHLHGHDIDTFYDIENIRAGEFEPIIFHQIASRPYLILVLTPGTLDRCVEDGDMLRREIEQAVATGRTIVPAFTPNFDFGDISRFLPTRVAAAVLRFNGVELSHRWFKYAVAELCEEFLRPITSPSHKLATQENAQAAVMVAVAMKAPVVTTAQLTAQGWFESANCKNLSDHHGRLHDLDEAIRLNPFFAMAYRARGEQHAWLRQARQALADFDEAIRLDPTDDGAFCGRANVQRSRDRQQALLDYTEAIRINPSNQSAISYRAEIYEEDGDLERAMEDYDRAFELRPDDGQNRIRRAALADRLKAC